MAWGTRALAPCALLLLCAGASAYTVDCNPDLTDCDKFTKAEDEVSKPFPEEPPPFLPTIPAIEPTIPLATESTPKMVEATSEVNKEEPKEEEAPEVPPGRPRPRLLNIGVDELQNFAKALHNQTDKKQKALDLSDVTLDDEEDVPNMHLGNYKLPEKFYTNLQSPFHHLLGTDNEPHSDESEICVDAGKTYKIGEQITKGCEEFCECMPGGSMECSPRCKLPFVRQGRSLSDPLCSEQAVDECCAIVSCASVYSGADGKKSLEMCKYGNETHSVGSSWNIGCEKTCTCIIGGIVTCGDRCPPHQIQPGSDVSKCFNVSNPKDPCCVLHFCDVSLDGHEVSPEHVTNPDVEIYTETPRVRPLVLAEPIGSITVLQNNTVQVNLIHPNNTEDPIHLLLSSDNGLTFYDVQLQYSNLILNLEGGKDYILKTKETGTKFNFTITSTGDSSADRVQADAPASNIGPNVGCYENGKFYAVGEEFQIGCEKLCECTGPEQRDCADLSCPNAVGLELVSKSCIKWEKPQNVTPPNCCPRTARCLSEGNCNYNGHDIKNGEDVPPELTNCKERCSCDNGELDCIEASCAPLTALPPQHMRCELGSHPEPVPMEYDRCCRVWGCVPNAHKHLGPTDFPTAPFISGDEEEEEFEDEDLPPLPEGFTEEDRKLKVEDLVAESSDSIKMVYSLSPRLVGSEGSIELKYTDNLDDENMDHWIHRTFEPENRILNTNRLEFHLPDLTPNTTYKIFAQLIISNIDIVPVSKVMTITTLPDTNGPSTPHVIRTKEVHSRLIVSDVTPGTATLTWSYFHTDDLKYIDAIQVRFRPIGTPYYNSTEMMHHGRNEVVLEGLRPETHYEASLVLIAPAHTQLELKDLDTVDFTTKKFIDPYNFTVQLEVSRIESDRAELRWRGVPSPEERWVRVYRAIYKCGDDDTHKDVFRVASREDLGTLTVLPLEPDTKCEFWLQLILTNGKVKDSNVLEIRTKPGDPRVVPASESRSSHDYYGALVGVSACLALAVLLAMLLALALARRHRPRSVTITPTPTAPARESPSPLYDSPAYKLELQQETLGNGLKVIGRLPTQG